MDNHFHLLVEVPDREKLAPLDEEGLLEVLPLLYDEETVEGVRQELERARLAGDDRWYKEILDRYEKRRGSLAHLQPLGRRPLLVTIASDGKKMIQVTGRRCFQLPWSWSRLLSTSSLRRQIMSAAPILASGRPIYHAVPGNGRTSSPSPQDLHPCC